MADDRRQFSGALEKWVGLKADRFLSAPQNVGTIAILCSYYKSCDIKDSKISEGASEKELKVFRKEALGIASMIEERGQPTEVALNAKFNDFTGVLTDPSISDIVIIGHGNLSEVFLEDAGPLSTYTWNDISQHADHLKTGAVFQRFCGGLRKDLNVPLGMFAVDTFTNVIAPVRQSFSPRGMLHPDNNQLRVVFAGVEPNYKAIKTGLAPLPDVA